jgi:hypothetical protein
VSASSERLKRIIEVVRDTVPQLEQKLEYCQSHPLDPKKQPAAHVLVTAYVHRLETLLSLIRSLPDSVQDGPAQHMNLMDELTEIETWIGTRKRRSDTAIASLEMEIGDYLASKGFSYSEIFRMLQIAKKGKRGAPPDLRPETLRAYDSGLAKGWSHPRITRAVCSCGKPEHGKQCEDRLRHRFRELEKVLSKYGFNPARRSRS